MVGSNLIMKNRLAGQSWGGFSRVYVFLYNNMKHLVKAFHLLQKHNIQYSFHFLPIHEDLLHFLLLLSFPIEILMPAHFSLMFTFKLIIYSLATQFIFNNLSKRLKLLFKNFFRLYI